MRILKKQHYMKHLLLLLLLVVSLTSPAQTNYSNMTNWYSGSFTTDKPVDVLFFPPTAVSDKDGQGHNMNPQNSDQRAALDYWFAIAKTLFGESCNFCGPYLRQATMESWGTANFAESYALAVDDVVAAFDYYMKYVNKGRPFILAGHSQGAKLVYSLIKKRINAENYPLMVAAYPIGFRVTQSDIDQSPYIVPACGSTDIGVCIAYHSAAYPSAAMYPGNYMNINPMNWSTDTITAPKSANLGSVFFDKNGKISHEFKGKITAQIDPKTGALIVKGLDPKEFFKPYVGGYQFKLGNYHLQDLNLFFRNLQQNVRDRIASYNYKRK